MSNGPPESRTHSGTTCLASAWRRWRLHREDQRHRTRCARESRPPGSRQGSDRDADEECARVDPGGRQGQSPGRADQLAREAVAAVRRQVPDHRLRAVELRELRHPAHRHLHAVQGAEPHPPRAAGLELSRRPLRRVRGTPAGAAADRDELVSGDGGRGLPESRHPAPPRSRPRADPGGGPRLQDGLRPPARGPRPRAGADDDRLHRRPAGRGVVPRRDGGGQRASRRGFRGETVAAGRGAGSAGPGARQHGHLRVRRCISVRPARARRRRRPFEPRFRQGRHSPSAAGGSAAARPLVRRQLREHEPGHSLLARCRHHRCRTGKRTRR